MPLAAIVDAGAHADGAEQCIGAGNNVRGVLEHGLDGEANIHGALLHQPGGLGMAINGVVIHQPVGFRNVVGVAPVEEILFDGFTLRMFADDAFPGVTFERGEFRFWE